MVDKINAEKSLIFRITHITNVRWILKNGLHCKNANCIDPDFVQIGNPELISKRTTRNVPIEPWGSLSDYIPFYFTPFSPMMYNITTGYGGIRQVPNSEIVILVSRYRRLVENGVSSVFTDRHAYLRTAKFFSSIEDLAEIDWELLRKRDFKRDPDDPEKTDRYQAEALIKGHLPVQHLEGIVCYGKNEKRTIEGVREDIGMDIKIVALPNWFF